MPLKGRHRHGNTVFGEPSRNLAPGVALGTQRMDFRCEYADGFGLTNLGCIPSRQFVEGLLEDSDL